MIRGAAAVLVAGLALFVLLVIPPIVGIGRAVFLEPSSFEEVALYGFRGGKVASTTLVWALSAGGLATLVGWIPGRRLSQTSSSWLLGLSVLPLALPAALFFDAWWLHVGPDSVVGSWAAQNGQVPLLRKAVLGLGFICWAWPISALCVAGRGGSGSCQLLARMDGLRMIPRGVLALREDRAGLCLGWILSSACIAGEYGVL